MNNVLEFDCDGIRIIQLNHMNRHNPFNRELEDAVKLALKKAGTDEEVEAVVMYGGPSRSFSAGGDFNEVKNLVGGEDVDQWIDRVTDLYTSVLTLEKPSVAAIEGMAIGIGFQLAMMFDWRLMSRQAALQMPELKHGIGCSVGAAILSELTTWNRMRDIIYRCEPISAMQAHQYGLINDVVDNPLLLDSAIATARSLARYPLAAFRNTKKIVNQTLIEKLEKSAADSKLVHRASFAAKDAQKHFRKILKEKYERVG